MLIFYLQMLDTPEEKARFEEIYRQYRAVMEMKLLSGYSDGEIAVKLGLSKK